MNTVSAAQVGAFLQKQATQTMTFEEFAKRKKYWYDLYVSLGWGCHAARLCANDRMQEQVGEDMYKEFNSFT